MIAHFDSEENQINVDITEDELKGMLETKLFKICGVYIGGREYVLAIGKELKG